MLVIAISNRPPLENYYCFEDFKKSVSTHDGELVLLPSTETQWHGLCDKPKFLLQYLLTTANLPKYLLFCDAWDVVITKSLNAVLDTFKQFNTSLVWNAERNLFPFRQEIVDKYPNITNWRYLNSGVCVGETEALLELLKKMRVEEIPNDYQDIEGQWHHFVDQQIFQDAFLRQDVPMKLDINCDIAQCLCDEQEENFEITKYGIKNLITGTYPGLIHANGPAKTQAIMPRFLELWRKNENNTP